MVDRSNSLLRKKTFTIKRSLISRPSIRIRTSLRDEDPLKAFQMNFSVEKFSHSFTPTQANSSSSKFERKCDRYDKFFRKIIGIKPKKPPCPIFTNFTNQIDPDEKILLEGLLKDQKKNQKEIKEKLDASITHILRSPKKKLLV
jgi:hypothetical protein